VAGVHDTDQNFDVARIDELFLAVVLTHLQRNELQDLLFDSSTMTTLPVDY